MKFTILSFFLLPVAVSAGWANIGVSLSQLCWIAESLR